MPTTPNRPLVGIGVAIFKDGKVLLGLRKGAHGEGTWCFPGGHLEFGESFEDCAARETEEETGLTITNFAQFGITNGVFRDAGKHYVTILMRADWVSGTPELCEPHKCAEWRWCEPSDLPEPLFLPIANFLATGADLSSFANG